jgi:peroxiredoxin
MLPGRASAAESDDTAPAFALPQHGGAGRVQLANLGGRIVVLDFFAYWCAPCARASTEMETGIDQYYKERKGNVHGIEVQTLAVNIEAGQPEKTEAFIQRTGLKQVLDDLDGKVFHDYGGRAIPFVVVIDATGESTGGVPARVVYRKAGFEGVAKLRRVIDAITQASTGQPVGKVPQNMAAGPPSSVGMPDGKALATPPPTAGKIPQNVAAGPPSSVGMPDGKALPTPPPAAAAAPAWSGGAVSHNASIDFASLSAPDILLTEELLEYRQTRPVSDLSLSLSEGHIGLHYVPESLLEKNKDVADDHFGFQTSDRFRAGDQLTMLIGGGAYSGYMDYRSLWFNEYFRQLFSRRSGYEKAHPWGGNASAGARWEYLPAAGFLQGEVITQHDVISPGYDVSLAKFPPVLERFRDTYDTLSGRLTLENVLTSRVRALQELQVTDATDRQLRVSLQSSLNWAVTERWVTRLVLSGTEESPHFESASFSVIVGRDWHDTWFLSLLARGYSDNGEVENALLAENTADPPLKTFLTGLELRWQGWHSFVKLFAGPYFTDYQQNTSALTTFPHLFQDRDWLCAQVAYAYEF